MRIASLVVGAAGLGALCLWVIVQTIVTRLDELWETFRAAT